MFKRNKIKVQVFGVKVHQGRFSSLDTFCDNIKKFFNIYILSYDKVFWDGVTDGEDRWVSRMVLDSVGSEEGQKIHREMWWRSISQWYKTVRT